MSGSTPNVPVRYPNFNHLYYFHVVAGEGTLQSAARRLGIRQSTISEQLRQLETFLGTRLFDRRAGGLHINDAGRIAYEHTTAMFGASNRLLDQFQMRRDLDRTVLEIGVTSSVSRSFASAFFLPVLRRDDVLVRIRQGDYMYLLRDLAAMELDILISDSTPSDAEKRGLKVHPVFKPQLSFVVSPKLLPEGYASPDILGELPFMSYTLSSRYRWEIDEFFREQSFFPRLLAEVDDVDIMLAAALDAACAVVLPKHLTESHVAAKSLVELHVLDGSQAELCAIYQQKDPSELILQAISLLTRV